MSSTNIAFINDYKSIHDRLSRYCQTKAFGIMSAEDLVQETVLQTLESYDRIKNQDNLLGYMIGVANNVCRQRSRRLKFKGSYDHNMAAQIQASIPDPDVALTVEELIKAIDKLPAIERDAIMMFEIAGMAIKDISEIQSCSISACKTRLSRSRKKLRNMLEDDVQSNTLTRRLEALISVLF